MPSETSPGTTSETSPSQTALLYEWTRQTRANLLNFVATMPPDDLTAEHPHIPMGSFRNLLVHVADAYRYWLGYVGMGEKSPPYDPEACPDLEAIRALFAGVDELVAAFLAAHPGAKLEQSITREVKRRDGRVRMTLTPHWLVTNGITHEFNHKGQLLTSARARGFEFEGRSDMAMPPGGYERLDD